ncbi:DNA polymerase III epsilon subunit-like protein [Streptomyces sp. SAI-208]|uniref:3'-5' exonuclease n=1 Tax=Streptomyces sp. SAI-208 TaxID=2940550 RepID=UPI0024742F77|nr:hypothetical protein [Streptomyces sp. SAI-208]MDH6610239.1 DNA polymerase III epsilon subunit-like protein [Streptomyces sp. SAI-208]
MSTTDTTKQTAPLAFIDGETTGLDPKEHSMWELAVIRRENGVDTEHLWQIRLANWEIEQADPKAMEINGYHERFALPEDYQAGEMLHSCGTPHPVKRADLRSDLALLLDGAVLVGSNPGFDASFLHVFLDARPWHYRTVDIALLAAGFRYGQAASGAYGGDFAFQADYPQPPYRSYEMSRAVGVEPPAEGVAHTALGDARWARDVFDAVTGVRTEALGGAA